MSIRYEKINRQYDRYIKLDTSKKNIILLGSGSTRNERCNIINPSTIDNAAYLYGEDSQLYKAYKDAYSITNMPNIYTVNCYTLDDYINIISKIVQYDFNFIVPLGINFREILYSSNTNEEKYYSSIVLEAMYQTESLSTLIMTDYHASDYEDIDYYLTDQKNIVSKFISKNNNYDILNNSGSNLIFTLNMLEEIGRASCRERV